MSKEKEYLKILKKLIKSLKTSIVVESNCDECGTFTAVRYEIVDIDKALTEAKEKLKTMGVG